MPVYISGIPSVIDTVSPDGVDSLSIDGIDTLAAATLMVSPTLMDLSLGVRQVVSAYVGTDLVYLYNPSQVFTLPPSQNFDLATFLAAQPGLDYSATIVITLPDGVSIGGVSDNAFTIDSIPPHGQIIINVAGFILGAVSGHAVVSDEDLTIDNSGGIFGSIVGGNTGGQTPFPIVFVISPNGVVAGGGGNGGQGGAGGQGDDVGAWDPFQSSLASPLYYFDTKGASFYNDVNVGSSPGPYIPTSNYVYNQGSFFGPEGIPEAPPPTIEPYEIRRAARNQGVSGIGGSGGVGSGYQQGETIGSSGAPGTNRSGSGGPGGDGGIWGEPGSDGGAGLSGLYYSTSSSVAVRSGFAGSPGISPGSAFFINTT